MSRLMGRNRNRTTSRPSPGDPLPAESPLLRWWQKLLLLMLSVVLLSLAFAPFKQFYLAWVGLVPWLVVVRRSRSAVTAFLWSWLLACGFFTANMWWLAYVTGPGMAALIAVLALYWGVAGGIVRGARLLEPGALWKRAGDAAEVRPVCPGAAIISIFLIAAVWTAFEWFRGYWPLGGLAWAYLGHSQSPVLHLCQVADLTGVYGVTFWVVLINAFLALLLLYRGTARRLVPAGITLLAVFAAILAYGVFRFSQNVTRPGPTCLVVQPDYPQSNSGEKGAEPVEIVNFHLRATREALAQRPDVNLVVWSETMMPALDPAAVDYASHSPSPYWAFQARLIGESLEALTDIARQRKTAFLVGGVYYDQFVIKPLGDGRQSVVPMDRRNSAYFIKADGLDASRYDKIHLVPFGESLPFKSALPPLYHLFLALSPYTEEYTLTAGQPDALTVFELKPGWRFVTPICFEDLDGELMRHMFAPSGSGPKRADFIINITNDGWFRFNEMPQHLQAAIFRCIENRAPAARSVNTGVSGFIDSLGRTSGLIPAGQEGTSVGTLALDDRVTFYTRWGDVFSYACMASAVLLAGAGIVRWWVERVGRRRKGSAA